MTIYSSNWDAPFSVLTERSSIFDELFFAGFFPAFAIGVILNVINKR